MTVSRTASCLFLGLIAATPVFGSPPAQYTIFDAQGAGTQSGEGTLPDGLNDSSVSTGYYIDGSGNLHGFVRAADGTITTFDAAGPSSETQPTAINRRGEVVGLFMNPKKLMVERAFLRSTNGIIKKYSAGGINNGASGLNDKGFAIGDYVRKNRSVVGYLRGADGAITDLRDPKAGKGEFEGTSPLAINDGGVITGLYSRQSGTYGFVRSADGTFTNFHIAGAGGFVGVYPDALNESGLITGYYTDSNDVFHGFVRDPEGTITSFDAPGAGTGAYQGTFAGSIASDGTIAGSYTDANNISHGFLRLKNGTIREFDVPGAGTGNGEGTVPFSINNAHVISGFEVDNNGVAHGFLRTPDGN